MIQLTTKTQVRAAMSRGGCGEGREGAAMSGAAPSPPGRDSPGAEGRGGTEGVTGGGRYFSSGAPHLQGCVP